MQRTRAILVAQGTPAHPGQDAHIEFTFDAERWAGEPLADDSVNFRERNAFHSVTAGQVLGTYRAPTPGVAGTTVLGGDIPVTEGEARTFRTNDNVRVSGHPKRYIARVGGTVRFRDDVLSVHETVRIEGDVGNIEAGHVFVSGSVKPALPCVWKGT